MPAVFIGALLPDIDTRNSVLGKFIPAWLFFKHRGFLHSFLGMALVLWIFSWGGNSALTYGIFIGYLSHLLADAVTPWGCPLFYPL